MCLNVFHSKLHNVCIHAVTYGTLYYSTTFISYMIYILYIPNVQL